MSPLSPFFALVRPLLAALALALPLASAIAETPTEAPTEAQTETQTETAPQAAVAEETQQAKVFVVPIKGEINRTQLFILRRALKEAVSEQATAVLLDIDTPGGEVGVTLKMMEALKKFPGTTLTYVNKEAVSAGSFIAVATDDIWFAPDGVMGAAEAVSGGGADIGESMQRKLQSYLQAKVRALGNEGRYRAQVQRAMMDPQYQLEIDGVTLKEAGELLSLTAAEAARTYGDPPEPLLSRGTADSIAAVLGSTYGEGNYSIRSYELSWSESFARWFQTLTPLLLAIGILLLFIEFKTPGFGFMGGVGIACLLLVFASNYIAGLAGHEVILIFLIGVALLGVEVFLFPGTLVAGALGALCIFGSLLWAMADIWPSGAQGFELSPELFYLPMLKLGSGLVLAVIGAMLFAKALPKTPLGRAMILSTTVGGTDPLAIGATTIGTGPATLSDHPALGSRGTAVTPLRPNGQVEIDGQRYPAQLRLGQIEAGEIIEVIGYGDFALLVRAHSGEKPESV